jgi:hypothetical protein
VNTTQRRCQRRCQAALGGDSRPFAGVRRIREFDTTKGPVAEGEEFEPRGSAAPAVFKFVPGVPGGVRARPSRIQI